MMSLSMKVIDEFNILIAPMGALIMVLADYHLNHTPEKPSRRCLALIVVSAIAAIVTEIVCGVLEGELGGYVRTAMYVCCYSFFILQFLAFAGIPLFIDYHLNRDTARLKRIALVLLALFAVNLAALILNHGRDFYFYIDAGNHYHHGPWHLIRVACLYAILAVAIVDAALCRHRIGPQQMAMVFFTVAPAGVFGALDLLVPGYRLLWPFFALSFLFAYLFIVKAEYSYDPLTRVHNRRSCMDYLASISRSARKTPYVVILADMDRFKQINDTLGHLVGDQALQDAAWILSTSVRRHDFVARYGGDEFLVVIKNSDDPGPVVERIERTVGKFNAEEGRPYTLGLSIGCDVYRPGSPEALPEFLERIDRLMYCNKAVRHETNTHAPRQTSPRVRRTPEAPSAAEGDPSE